MSDHLNHECGIAVVRLRKPLAYFQDRYGDSLWGFRKLFLLMEKQHNRGQDGAGIGTMKLNVPAGEAFMFRERSTSSNALAKIFGKQLKHYQELLDAGQVYPEFPETVKLHFDHG
ncbi:MAG: amidophosphoribosyltransferase, partial [Roseibacillus sp.]